MYVLLRIYCNKKDIKLIIRKIVIDFVIGFAIGIAVYQGLKYLFKLIHKALEER